MSEPAPRIGGIHHSAFRCRDAEETLRFYRDLLGLKPRAALRIPDDPLTGEAHPYLHLFFEMGDGNFIAFFDAPSSATADHFRPDHPFDLHYAMEVADQAEMMTFKARLEAHGIEVMGPLDHGFIHSIYFYDPNGLMLEFTCRDARHEVALAEAEAELGAVVAEWTRDTAAEKRRFMPASAQAAE
jgi:catechol 2,3-dioxygenase-like lactoylglutathione lyase family enzyme